MIESLKNKSNSIALIGSSNDPRKYGNKILLDLTKKGYTVYPVNKKEKEIEGKWSNISWSHVASRSRHAIENYLAIWKYNL